MPRLFRRSHRYNVARNCFLARVILLDNTTIEFNLLPEVTGSDCLEKVAQVMEISEINYFGLLYQTKYDQHRWVDRDKPLRKQLEKYGSHGARDAELRFRVQYYVTTVTKLQFEITRYLYFLQLKHLILNGELQCSNDLAVKLASYALQAEFSDYDEDKHTDEFLSDYIFLPPHIGPPSVIQSLTERASKLHQKHRSMSPAAAELMYIKLAQQLPEYGHETFQALDVHGSTIWIGACFIGVFVKHSNGQPNIYFKWPDIFRMKVRDKNFGIETPGETVYFKTPSSNSAQYVLRMMINQHKFYRSELEGMPGLSWTASVEGTKKKSRSLHDLRSKLMGGGTSHTHAVSASAKNASKSKFVKESAASIQRPLHRSVYREGSAEPRFPTANTNNHQADHHIEKHSDDPVQLLSINGDGPDLRVSPEPRGPVAMVTTTSNEQSASQMTPEAAGHSSTAAVDEDYDEKEHNSSGSSGVSNGAIGDLTVEARRSLRQGKKPNCLTLPTSNDITIPPRMYPEEAVEMTDGVDDLRDDLSHTSSRSGATPKSSPQVRLKGKNNGHIKQALTNGSGDQGDTDSSQETFELFGSLRKKITGSLEHLDSRTPPRSLKIRTFSVEEQQEQEAASGTHDRRGSQLEKKVSSGKFYTEYELLPKKKLHSDTNSGQLPENIHKNRYRDILPYEDTRVRLNPANNTIGSDYINASFVNFTVNGVTRRYVVAQGPLEHTSTDFWQMVWEHGIQFILMVTNEVEDCRNKCHRYFPPDDKLEGKQDYVQFDQYRVSRLFVEKTKTVISRGFQLKHIPSGEERKITHLQYIDWPDHGIPDNPQPFLNFLAEVRSLRQTDSKVPVLVHCSAGVGRSGVVVLVDMLMAKVDSGEPIDIVKSLKDLRQQRMHLVQMVGQYKFVYSAIIQYIGRARLI